MKSASSLHAIILARSGSKRIPGKNFSLEFEPGRTLLQIAIEKTLEVAGSALVSTDSEHVADIAAGHGADTIISPHHGDNSTSIDAVCYAADAHGWTGTVLLAQLTSPLVEVEHIRSAVEAFDGTHPLFAARSASEIFWAWDEDGPIFPQWQGVRSQEHPHAYLPAGAFYVGTIEHFRDRENFMRRGWRPFEIPREMAIDVDTIDDLRYTQWQARRLRDLQQAQ